MSKLRLKLLSYSLFLFFIALVGACSDSADCGYLQNRKVKMNFVKNDKKYSDTTISKFTVLIPAMNEILYDTVSSNTLNLSLDQNSDSSVFILKIKDIYDTLFFKSTRRLEMISSDCGFNTRFSLDTLVYTSNNILSIQKIDNNIDKEVLKNYRIVMKTAPATVSAK